jgi:hypothetical protein
MENLNFDQKYFLFDLSNLKIDDKILIADFQMKRLLISIS